MEKITSLTASESIVMKCIWDANEEISLGDIFIMCNERFHKDWKYQTVSTFLIKLVQKGFISPRREGHRILYEILIPEENYIAQQAYEFVHFWNRGSASQFLISFYRDQKITKEEIQDLEKILDTHGEKI